MKKIILSALVVCLFAACKNQVKTEKTPEETVKNSVASLSEEEAFLIIECQLAQTHTVNLEEVYVEHNRKFFEDAYKEVGSYHKIVFGDITNVWVRK
jgi:hypothetical protein